MDVAENEWNSLMWNNKHNYYYREYLSLLVTLYIMKNPYRSLFTKGSEISSWKRAHKNTNFTPPTA